MQSMVNPLFHCVSMGYKGLLFQPSLRCLMVKESDLSMVKLT